MNLQELYNEKLKDLIEEAAAFDLASDEAKTAMPNLKTFSEICIPPVPEPDPIPEIVNTTVWGKTKAFAARMWESETTRVCVKSGGTLIGVIGVAYATIHKDTVLERQAIAQANQPPPK